MFAFVVSLTLFSCNSGKNNKQSKVQTIDDLPGAVIGVQLGTTGDIFVSDYEKEGSVVERYNKAADAVQALKLGKIDCIVIDKAPADAFVAINSDLSILDEEFAVEEYAICISKENPELREKINTAIAQMRAEGTLERIISNYIGDSTKGKYPYESPENVDRSNGTLNVATNATFEPYEYIEGGEITGIDIDIAKAICDILGMSLKIQDIEFDSIISSVQSGKSDIALSGMTVTEDRLKSIDFTDSYTTATQVIIVRNGSDASELSFKEKFHNNFVVERLHFTD